MIAYVKCLDSNKTMSFQDTDKKLLKKYKKIWVRFSSLIGKEFNNKPVCGDTLVSVINVPGHLLTFKKISTQDILIPATLFIYF